MPVNFTIKGAPLVFNAPVTTPDQVGLPIRNWLPFIGFVICTSGSPSKRCIVLSANIGGYFPKLPTYQTFTARLNQLEPTFQAIGAQLQARLNARQAAELDQLIDSTPIVLACGRHAYTAKETADVGYCASKKLFFHGVRLHAVVQRRRSQFPQPQERWLREASCNGLRSFKEQELDLLLTTVFAEKAYCDRALSAELAEQGIALRTPQKQLKGTELTEWEVPQSLRKSLAIADRRLFQLATKENPDSSREHCTLRRGAESPLLVQADRGLFNFSF